jgi:hypothetical protein
VPYLLIILILAVGGGSYHEYSIRDQQLTKLKEQQGKLAVVINGLQANIQKLETDKEALVKKIAASNSTATQLTTTLADAKTTASNVQAAQDQAKTAADTAQALQATAEKDLAAAMHPPSTNQLGTIVTLNQKTYQNCVVKEVQPDGLYLTTSQGFVTILYPFLPGIVQRQFGYDPSNQVEFTSAQVQALEQVRIVGGNN